MAGPVGTPFYAGKGAAVSAEGVLLYKADWDIDYKGDKLDTTNFQSGGFDQSTIGIIGFDWNIRGLWSGAGNQQFIDPPGLFPRDNLGTTIFYLTVSLNQGVTIQVSTIMSSKIAARVREMVTFETSGCSNGSGITIPGQ